jgi:hypothetical protein
MSGKSETRGIVMEATIAYYVEDAPNWDVRGPFTTMYQAVRVGRDVLMKANGAPESDVFVCVIESADGVDMPLFTYSITEATEMVMKSIMDRFENVE